MKKPFIVLSVLLLAANMVQAQKKPNVILILADDMGWTDLSCYGSKFYETPNIDQLAASGMKFTNAYSACNVCSPTRASIMTGKSPARLHLTDWITGHKMPFAKLSPPNWTMALPTEEITIAEVLKKSGYTTGAIGKWHLGTGAKFAPTKQGFDYYFAGSDTKELSAQNVNGKATKELTDEALKFLTAKKDSAFFLYLPYYAVHLPIQASKENIAYFKNRVDPESKQNNPNYAAMIKELDTNVGRVMSKLNELHLTENTLVIFISDNGGLIGRNNTVTSNLPLRAGKGSPYEGGVRVPAIFSWKGKIKPGTVSPEQIISTDLFNTIATVGGASFKSYDGINILPVLHGNNLKKSLHDRLYWHYPHYHNGGSTPYSAILEGNKRLVYFYETGKKEYYDIAKDISEKNDLYATHTKEADQLYKKLQSWLTSSKVQYAVPNPKYDKKKQHVKAAGKEN